MKAKTKTAGHLKVGERIETTTGMREVLALEPHFTGYVKVVVQDPSSPATARAPLGETTISMSKKSKVRFFPATACGCGTCPSCVASQGRAEASAVD